MVIKLQYFCPIDDDFGYTHSIDNLIIEYDIKGVGQKGIDTIIDKIHEIRDKNDLKQYWERLNVNACSKYQYYNNHLRVDVGIYMMVGRYVEFVAERKDKFFVYPIVKLEVNPNKHFENLVLQEILLMLQEMSAESRLVKYDYCIDIPVNPVDVEVFGTRKQQGLYKGTRYYGQRNKNGYCKIYDKQKEQKLETPLTRVEHTIESKMKTKSISFENIYIKDEQTDKEEIKINSTNRCIVELCNALAVNDIPYESIINKLDKRTKRTIKECITNSGYRKLEFNESIHTRLINNIKLVFKLIDVVTEDDNGFLQLDDDYKNPWEE